MNDFVLLYRAPTKWIQCTKCHKWAHGHCAGFSDLGGGGLLSVGIATLLIVMLILSLNTDVMFVT